VDAGVAPSSLSSADSSRAQAMPVAATLNAASASLRRVNECRVCPVDGSRTSAARPAETFWGVGPTLGTRARAAGAAPMSLRA
jgi:hypothetical protein